MPVAPEASPSHLSATPALTQDVQKSAQQRPKMAAPAIAVERYRVACGAQPRIHDARHLSHRPSRRGRPLGGLCVS